VGKDVNMSDFERYKGLRVLVTGASGFLGGAIVRRLIDYGAMIWCLERDLQLFHQRPLARFPWREIEDIISGDLRDYWACERAIGESSPHIVFHCAAMTQVGQSRVMPLQSYQTNVMGTVNLLDNLRQMRPTPIIVSSSDKAYGHPVEEPISEYTRFNPVHPYDTSKAAMDLIASSYGKYYDMNVAITRCGNIYGPGDCNWQRLVPGIFRDMIKGNAPIIRSDGKQVRDYNYIDDIVDAYLLLGQKMMHVQYAGCGYIISANEHHSVLDMVKKMRSIVPELNPKKPKVLGEAQDETEELVLDGRRFRQEFDWEPRVTLDQGLRKTADWLMMYLRRGR